MMASESFMSAYRRWVDEPFPRGSDHDDLDEIHAQLAYADAMVAEAAVPIAKNVHQTGVVPGQALTELRAAMARAHEYTSASNDEHAQVAATYLRYAEVLLGVINELD